MEISRPRVGVNVQLAQYSNTFFYYAAGFTSGLFMISEPIMQLAAYSLFNNWSLSTIIQFGLTWVIALYTIILTVATVDIQAILLTVEVYVRGIVLFLLFANLFQLGFTFYFYLQSIQFRIKDPKERNGYNTTTMDLIYWSIIQVVPRIILMSSIHLFMVDINAYFEQDPGKANNLYNPLILSGPIDWLLAVKDDATNWVNRALSIAQAWTFTNYMGYATPNKVMGYITKYVLTVVF